MNIFGAFDSPMAIALRHLIAFVQQLVLFGRWQTDYRNVWAWNLASEREQFVGH
jgi:hypothetical protein